MAVLGTLGSIDGKKNPPEVLDKDGNPTRAYTIDDFLFYLPSFKNVAKKQSSNSLEFYENSKYYLSDKDDAEEAKPYISNTSPLYELIGGEYVLTTDNSFVEGKEYFRDKNGTLATPKNTNNTENGSLYEYDFTERNYVLTNDTEFIYEKSYFKDNEGKTKATPRNSNVALYEFKNEEEGYVPTADTDFLPNKTYYKDSTGTLVATPANCNLYETELQVMFNALFPIAYGKIFYTVFGKDWYYAMSLCIAHYNYLINIQTPNSINPNRKIGLSDVTGGGVTRGVMTNASIGGFSKTYDLNYTALSTEEALFWNQSSYGMSLLALFKSKATLTMFVVTNGPLVPGTPPFNRFGERPWGSDWVDDMINPRKFRP